MGTRWTDFRIKHSGTDESGYIYRAIAKGDLSEDQVAAILAKKFSNEAAFTAALQALIDKDLLAARHVTSILNGADPRFSAYYLGDQDLMEDGDDNYDSFREETIYNVGRHYGAINVLIHNRKLNWHHVDALIQRLPSMYSQDTRDNWSSPRINELVKQLEKYDLLDPSHTPRIIPGIRMTVNPDAGLRSISTRDAVYEFLTSNGLLRRKDTPALLEKVSCNDFLGKEVIADLARLHLLGPDAVDEIVRRVDPNHHWDQYGDIGSGHEIVVILARHGLLSEENKATLLEKLHGDGSPARSAIINSRTRTANRPQPSITDEIARFPMPDIND